MLIKEYRIPLPLTVEEYRIAQLYMIAKKSRDESSGQGSGVEILINEPYGDGPGGSGQYTRKIYHVGSHLPGWFKGILPKNALVAEEEAWNAYPYTKTRYTCPFVEKFSLEIETYYFADNGHQENVFKLSGSDLRNRVVDLIDVAKDQLYGGDYLKEEDPTVYVSEKTGRGPLAENWLAECWREVEGKSQPTPSGKSLMCAYKLCKVEFRYWGMQTKIERFIHDVALRKTMLRAHRQAWAWQDEWHGLTMEDIREIEKQTQMALKRKMGQLEDEDLDEDNNISNGTHKTLAATLGSIEKKEDSPLMTKSASRNIPTIETGGSDEDLSGDECNLHLPLRKHGDQWQQSRALHSPSSSSAKSFDQVANWRIASLGRNSESGSDEEFYDCEVEQTTETSSSSLAKWSSLDLLTEEDPENSSPTVVVDEDDSIFSPTFLQRVASERGTRKGLQKGKGNSLDVPCPDSPGASPCHTTCSTTVLLLVFHAGSVLDANVDMTAKKSDVTTFRGAFESVMRQHYPTLVGHIAIKLVSCPSICTEGLGILSSLSPYSFDVSPSCTDVPQVTHDSIPIGAIPLLACSNPEYNDCVSRTINGANMVYQEFLKSEEGHGFSGQICIVGDSVGSILAFDALSRTTRYQSRHGSENSILDQDGNQKGDDNMIINESGHLVAPSPRRRSSSTSEQSNQIKFDFDITDFFMFGSPLALVLAYRKISSSDDKNSAITRPCCLQVYNLFHPTDPVASRLEPLLSARFSMLAPVNIARYAKYPLGNGQPYHLLEILQSNPQMFNESGQPRRLSEVSIQSTVSGIIDNIPLQAINALQQKWWGGKRLDYALYCPEGLSNFPTHALPHLLHASYWESSDVIAFILRQVGRLEGLPLSGNEDREPSFHPGQPREKWIRKRTSVKLKNVSANHRANDVIVSDGSSQCLIGRFMYGPLDMITLTGEKVDIHVMRDVPSGEWTHLTTEVTDKAGRVTYTIPDDKTLGYGLYPVKMVVRGDHTAVDFFMAVVPPRTECVVFSIDGSFTASMSVTGRDPKVRAGAVDVVRHWQELGYLIIYTTGRPDMQHHRVVSWLSQHNFPHGLVSFADGLSTDPLGHKAAYLNNLIEKHGVVVYSAYGSSKDISVYTSLGLKQKQIFIVGKVSKKHHSQATILTEGYAAHLASLMVYGGSRPAQGNARMVIPRGYFGLPGQGVTRRRSHDTGISSPSRNSGFLKRKQ
ncbi:PREDICTED: protein retinal degeneration B isoform X3 [Nicrophorus vespilloides]|uniref:Protein retinal degeneration B isoform X3 n=1 Tax=Nicrophorus vespilloides TaxID=110193 RepID=A0ABM1NDG8_NICVS|nr:PREDICTED: protein retinal degeneration B isoform X3 [Nicrophorus vespilloides]